MLHAFPDVAVSSLILLRIFFSKDVENSLSSLIVQKSSVNLDVK